MHTMDFVDQSHWDSSYDRIESPTPASQCLVEWIEKFIPPGNGTCFEIGCYPGTYLSIFGQLGYELHGVDATPLVEANVPKWLAERGYRVGDIRCQDFFAMNPNRQYDIVASLGFIEHFTDWQSVLTRTASLVKPGGWLVLESPNFAGIIQRVVRMIGDPEDYSRHNIRAMVPFQWSSHLQQQGFHILSCEYLGGFDFGISPDRQNVFQKSFMWMANRAKWRLAKILSRPHRAYSPFCGVIAQKKR